jgi:hypothetical protein
VPERAARLAAVVLSILVAAATPISAQTSAASPQPTATGALKVLLTCGACDVDHLRKTLSFVEILSDGATAEVEVAATSAAANPETRWTLTLRGLNSQAGHNRTVTFGVAATATPEQARADFAQFLALALAPYAAASEIGPHMDVTFERPGGGDADARRDQRDPWNYWVFRLGANLYQSGEQTTSSGSYGVNASANRTTGNWKLRFAASRSLSSSEFEIEDEVIESRLTDWQVDALVVKSLGARWSWGLTSSVTGSTFSNAEIISRFMPGMEYDVFPYAESSRRSLTIQYTAGFAHYEYQEVTIFDRIQEDVGLHTVNVSLGLRQPWGSTGASFAFTQHLTSLDRTRLTTGGNFSVRLTRSLSVNGNASYSRIRDLFTLPRGDASDEEVLLRLRQLDTGFRYSFNVGFSYAFGALSNTTVNPRFGG